MAPTTRQQQKTAIVIGAGVGGVSTAARLAHAGFKVTVLEKNDFTGGRCSLLYSPDKKYRFDQGPSLLLLPGLFHQTFADLDTSLETEGVELRKCEPNYRIWFGDGEQFELSSDLAIMKREVEKWEGKDGYERYMGFLQESHRHYELSVEHVLSKNFTSLTSMLRMNFLGRLLDLHPFQSIYSRASKYFWTDRLRRVFTFGSMYMGMSPFDAPGTYSLLQYTELAEGIWYPVGGFNRVVQALVTIGKRLGITYRLETEVEQILLSEDGLRTIGVQTKDGHVLHADVVVNNTDLVYAYNNLLPQRTPYAASLSERPASCSSISFYWGLKKQFPELEAHNIFLAEDYKESFDSIFKKHLLPDEPSFYVNVPSRVDDSASPKNTDSVVVLVPVGHLIDEDPLASTSGSSKVEGGIKPTPRQDWPTMIALARKTILSTIKNRTGADLEPHIVHEITNDPVTWKDRFNLDRGAILGLSHSFFNVLSFRPSTRARRQGPLDGIMGKGILGRVGELIGDAVRRGRDIQGLYMVGASAHPGTGVPICLAGGKIVAEQVLDDLSMEVPWRGSKTKEKTVLNKLDVVNRSPDWQWWQFGIIALECCVLYGLVHN